MFFGRKDELKKLIDLLDKKTASLVVVKGRRRIGKSSLIQKFGENFDLFCEIQGVAPRKSIKPADQRQNFSEHLKDIFNIPALTLENWNDAFSLLANQTQTGKVLILLDEISWMANRSQDFAGKLKIAWDTKFKNNDQLILVVCGSVSSWIDRNILYDTDFVGRISLTINLEELPLKDCNKFWGDKASLVSSMERSKILSVTGGVPKYLEEINIKKTAEENIKKMCFDEGGILFKEFEIIFNDIFSKRSKVFKDIVKVLAKGQCSGKEIGDALGKTQNSDLSQYLSDLEASGFIKRYFNYKISGQKSRLSYYRIKDNYLRFYLKYIEPVQDKIKQGLYQFMGIENLPNWRSIMGFQFENLVLHNLSEIVKLLGIDFNSIISAAPYYQKETKSNKSACQIDLLIHTRFNTLYVCEIKYRDKIKANIIQEMETKISILKKPKNVSIRPVLIYEGELSDSVRESDFFDSIIHFGELLNRQ